MPSTAKQIGDAIEKARQGFDYSIASLDIEVRLRPPKASEALDVRKYEAKNKNIDIYVIVDVMIRCIALCTGRSIADAEILFCEDDFERGELGRKCLRLCGCAVSLKVLALAERTVSKTDAKDEVEEEQKAEVFT